MYVLHVIYRYEDQFYVLLNTTAQWMTDSGYAITEDELLDEFAAYDWEGIAEELFAYASEALTFFLEVLLFLVYILLARNSVPDFNYVTKTPIAQKITMSYKVREDIKTYLITKSFIALINGIAAGALLAIFQVPLASTFGLLTVATLKPH